MGEIGRARWLALGETPRQGSRAVGGDPGIGGPAVEETWGQGSRTTEGDSGRRKLNRGGEASGRGTVGRRDPRLILGGRPEVPEQARWVITGCPAGAVPPTSDTLVKAGQGSSVGK